MTLNHWTGRLLLLAFMALVGFSIAKSLYVGSVMGTILALTSLSAGIYFIYLLVQMRTVRNEEEPSDYWADR
ncbi:MAG: hypothetical protein NVV59_00455 [Chitinophagaceae bacterium]|nr:hypothetical protein [Chitinophagaceae bacterium]